MRWHLLDIPQTEESLGTGSAGLTAAEAGRRLAEYGPNELKESVRRTPFAMVLDQFKDFMILVLIGSSVVAGIAGKLVDSLAIMAIVVLNAIIGALQEFKAEKAMAALKSMAAPSAAVVRDGAVQTIPARGLVPGDAVLLDAGQIVPADIRIIESAILRIEEAALTGESVPVEKDPRALHDEFLPLGDRRNIAYQGTIVTYGRGKGIVVATGMDTEIGAIAAGLQAEKDTKTPLQQRLAVFGQRLAVAILAICGVVFVAGLMRGEPVMLMFLTAVSLAVAAIPEALPAVITIALALGAKKMVRQNALVRKLAAVETLGSVTYICSDKTGTLTLNRMTVEEVYIDGVLSPAVEWRTDAGGDVETLAAAPSRLFAYALALSNDARRDAGGVLVGDPTETALFAFSAAQGLDKDVLEKELPRIAELPFDSDRKCMTTVHAVRAADGHNMPFRYLSFTKGAIEVLSDRATTVLTASGPAPVDAAALHRVSDRMAADGLRVLGVAVRFYEELPPDITTESVEGNLVLVGLAGLMDPPRQEARDAVALCKSAGIRPVMITGDHPLTARAIARRIGIIGDDEGKTVLTGRELERLSDDEFEAQVEHISVYARVAPEQKLKIVRALKDCGQFIAMTGDGVNDAPALKSANIGIAMGVTGTGVAKEASSMILLDDNFATIVKAVKEGRRIYDNILKFITYTMTSNAGTLWAVFLAPFFGLPLPMVPIQILWMNLLCDSLPGLALTTEPAEPGIMQRTPRPPDEGVFSQGRGTYIIKYGLVIGIAALLFQKLAITAGMHWQTMVFSGLVIGRMGVVMAVRSGRESLWAIGPFSNKPLVGAIALIVVLQLGVVYAPVANAIFRTEPLSPAELGLTAAFASLMFAIVETEKFFRNLRRRANAA